MASKLLRVGLTGASGFIGSHLRETLASHDGIQVRLLRRRSKKKTLRSEELIRPVKDLDVIFHLAAVNRGSDREVLDGNITGTWNLLEAVKQAGNVQAHIVFASSGQIYPPSDRPIRETVKVVPPTVYGLSKFSCEHLIRLSGLPHTLLRLSNVYGPGCRPGYNSVIATFCERALRGQPLVVHGKGTQGRDFIFIDDVVEGFQRAGNSRPRNRTYNLSWGRTSTLKQIVTQIQRQVAGTRVEFQPKQDTGPRTYCLDNTRFKNDFNWKPRVTLTRGIAETLKQFQSG